LNRLGIKEEDDISDLQNQTLLKLESDKYRRYSISKEKEEK